MHPPPQKVEYHTLSISRGLGLKSGKAALYHHMRSVRESPSPVCVYNSVKAIGSWQLCISAEGADLEAKLAH